MATEVRKEIICRLNISKNREAKNSGSLFGNIKKDNELIRQMNKTNKLINNPSELERGVRLNSIIRKNKDARKN